MGRSDSNTAVAVAEENPLSERITALHTSILRLQLKSRASPAQSAGTFVPTAGKTLQKQHHFYI